MLSRYDFERGYMNGKNRSPLAPRARPESIAGAPPCTYVRLAAVFPPGPRAKSRRCRGVTVNNRIPAT